MVLDGVGDAEDGGLHVLLLPPLDLAVLDVDEDTADREGSEEGDEVELGLGLHGCYLSWVCGFTKGCVKFAKPQTRVRGLRR